ncbi:MAG: hypothetical protein H6662_01540 [Ardenticatenaceae bacterium]|nr:hypothetical protein [Anaerolineales bacterium]MCB8920240.1 hypothetical protein [Ardenticatenaceae bacterium]MCB8991973.1 hypothetical protein [Ardenticatenaceae bacterium]MCB9004912.1 hypothetical protein [Ardenticatenaceae bacterium]
MELRRYWQLFLRRWLLVVIPAAVVLAVGLVTYQPPAQAYNVGVRFLVAQPPQTAALTVQEERYYNWLASEYIVNGLTDWVQGRAFATAVSAQLLSEGIDVPAGAIQIAADNARSMLTLSISYGDAEALAAMMQAAITVMTAQNGEALPQLGGETAVIVPLDEPIVVPISAGLRSQLDLPLRIVLALGAGVGLALLVEYLDPTLRDKTDIEKMGFTIIGEIPKDR